MTEERIMNMVMQEQFAGMGMRKPLFSRWFKQCFIIFAITAVSAMAMLN